MSKPAVRGEKQPLVMHSPHPAKGLHWQPGVGHKQAVGFIVEKSYP